MTKANKLKVGGVWKDVVNVWIKQGGVWKDKVVPKIMIGGVWKECISYYEPTIIISSADSSGTLRAFNADLSVKWTITGIRSGGDPYVFKHPDPNYFILNWGYGSNNGGMIQKRRVSDGGVVATHYYSGYEGPRHTAVSPNGEVIYIGGTTSNRRRMEKLSNNLIYQTYKYISGTDISGLRGGIYSDYIIVDPNESWEWYDYNFNLKYTTLNWNTSMYAGNCEVVGNDFIAAEDSQSFKYTRGNNTRTIFKQPDGTDFNSNTACYVSATDRYAYAKGTLMLCDKDGSNAVIVSGKSTGFLAAGHDKNIYGGYYTTYIARMTEEAGLISQVVPGYRIEGMCVC